MPFCGCAGLLSYGLSLTISGEQQSQHHYTFVEPMTARNHPECDLQSTENEVHPGRCAFLAESDDRFVLPRSNGSPLPMIAITILRRLLLQKSCDLLNYGTITRM
jgi:hypothetical protein